MLPPSTSSVRSPLITSFSFPLGDSCAFANNNRLTNKRMTARKKTMVRRMVVLMTSSVQISMPIKAINAMPIRPVKMKVMPRPFSGAGILE